MLNRVESTKFSQAVTVVYTQDSGVPYNTAYGWNMANVEAQCSVIIGRLRLFCLCDDI